jgi:uncharacterized protein YggL (DUF469 family)
VSEYSYLVVFPRIDHPGETYSIVYESSAGVANEAEAIDRAINEVESEYQNDMEGTYPEDLNVDPADMTCRKLTEAERKEVEEDMSIG